MIDVGLSPAPAAVQVQVKREVTRQVTEMEMQGSVTSPGTDLAGSFHAAPAAPVPAAEMNTNLLTAEGQYA